MQMLKDLMSRDVMSEGIAWVYEDDSVYRAHAASRIIASGRGPTTLVANDAGATPD